jgi:membrane protein DedA with SNARE-associated domain
VKRFGRYVGITSESVSYTKELFASHHDIIIFTSKLTSGLGFGSVIMFTAGLSRVPFRRYMMLNIAGQFLWTAAMLSIGYFLGHIYLRVGDAFEKMALFALVVLIAISLIGFSRYLRTYLTQSP